MSRHNTPLPLSIEEIGLVTIFPPKLFHKKHSAQNNSPLDMSLGVRYHVERAVGIEAALDADGVPFLLRGRERLKEAPMTT